jgi:hypothetical protein
MILALDDGRRLPLLPRAVDLVAVIVAHQDHLQTLPEGALEFTWGAGRLKVRLTQFPAVPPRLEPMTRKG